MQLQWHYLYYIKSLTERVPACLDILSILPELLRPKGVINICALRFRATRNQQDTVTGATGRLQTDWP